MLENFCFLKSKIKPIRHLLVWAALFFSPWSQAGMHIEPYAGLSFTFANSKPLIESSLNQTSQALNYVKQGRYYSGFIAGMRLGYSSLGFAVGGDFSVGHWISLYKEDWTAFRAQENITPIMPGLFVSYKFPAFFRVYATLIPITLVHFSNHSSNSKYCKQSSGGKIGVSYISIPFLSINLEYLPFYISGENCRSWSHTAAIYATFII